MNAKKTLTGGLMVAFLFAATSAPLHAADGWAFWGGQTLPEHQMDEAYRLPTKGWDTRVYEWTPKGNPDVTCIAQFSESGPVGMQCFPQATERGAGSD